MKFKTILSAILVVLFCAGIIHAQNPPPIDPNGLLRYNGGRIGINPTGATSGQVVTWNGSAIVWGAGGGGGGGDVTKAGNNAFTGQNTLSGSTTFSGAVTNVVADIHNAGIRTDTIKYLSGNTNMQDGNFYDTGNAVWFTTDRYLWDGNGHRRFDFQNGSIYDDLDGLTIATSSTTKQLRNNTTPGNVVLDWKNKFLTNSWAVDNFTISKGLAVFGPQTNFAMVFARSNVLVSAVAMTPEAKVHVVVTNQIANELAFLADVYGVSNAVTIAGRHALGTQASPSAVVADTLLASFGGRGYGATAFSTNSKASIGMHSSETWSDSAMGSYIRFSTTSNLTTVLNEAMRIDHNGNLGLGTTTPTAKLHVVGNGLISNITAFSSFQLGNPAGTTNLVRNISGIDIRDDLVLPNGGTYYLRINGSIPLQMSGTTVSLLENAASTLTVNGAMVTSASATNMFNGLTMTSNLVTRGRLGINTNGPLSGVKVVVIEPHPSDITQNGIDILAHGVGTESAVIRMGEPATAGGQIFTIATVAGRALMSHNNVSTFDITVEAEDVIIMSETGIVLNSSSSDTTTDNAGTFTTPNVYNHNGGMFIVPVSSGFVSNTVAGSGYYTKNTFDGSNSVTRFIKGPSSSTVTNDIGGILSQGTITATNFVSQLQPDLYTRWVDTAGSTNSLIDGGGTIPQQNTHRMLDLTNSLNGSTWTINLKNTNSTQRALVIFSVKLNAAAGAMFWTTDGAQTYPGATVYNNGSTVTTNYLFGVVNPNALFWPSNFNGTVSVLPDQSHIHGL